MKGNIFQEFHGVSEYALCTKSWSCPIFFLSWMGPRKMNLNLFGLVAVFCSHVPNNGSWWCSQCPFVCSSNLTHILTLSHVLYIIPIILIYLPHMVYKFMPWVWPNDYYFVCHTFHLSSMLFPNSLTFYLICLAKSFPLSTYIDELYGKIIHYTNYLCIENVKICGATNQWGQSSSWKKNILILWMCPQLINTNHIRVSLNVIYYNKGQPQWKLL